MLKVAKFGGTSLADSEQFKKVYAIVKNNDERKYVVVYRTVVIKKYNILGINEITIQVIGHQQCT